MIFCGAAEAVIFSGTLDLPPNEPQIMARFVYDLTDECTSQDNCPKEKWPGLFQMNYLAKQTRIKVFTILCG